MALEIGAHDSADAKDGVIAGALTKGDSNDGAGDAPIRPREVRPMTARMPRTASLQER